MISEMTKNAGMALGERVKIAAAIIAMSNYDRVQAEMAKQAGLKETLTKEHDIDTPAKELWRKLNEPHYIKALQDLQAQMGLGKQSSLNDAVLTTAGEIQKIAALQYGVSLTDEMAIQAAAEAISEVVR